MKFTNFDIIEASPQMVIKSLPSQIEVSFKDVLLSFVDMTNHIHTRSKFVKSSTLVSYVPLLSVWHTAIKQSGLSNIGRQRQ